MPLLRETLKEDPKGILFGLPFGDTLDQAALLLCLWNAFYLGGDRKPPVWHLSNKKKVFYNGQGLRIL